MKFTLLIFLSFLSAKTFSQSRLEYGDFIQWDDKIEWAAETNQYIDLTPKIPKYSIKNFYLNKLKDSGIKAYIINPDGYSVTPRFLTRENLNQPSVTDTFSTDQAFDEEELKYIIKNIDTTSLFYKNLTSCLCSNCQHSSLIDIIKVKQLIYYKDATFHIVNTLLTPMCIRGEGAYAGDLTAGKLFNVAFNNDPNLVPSKKIIFIGTIEKEYNFNNDITRFPEERKILTAKNSSVMQLIMKDWENRKITAYDPNKLTIEKDGQFPIDPEPVGVAIFDSSGMQIGEKFIKPEFNIDSFYYFKIKQDIYFDPINEKLISKIKNVTMRKEVYTNEGIYLGRADCATFFYDKQLPQKSIYPYVQDKKKTSIKKQKAAVTNR